VEGDYVGVLDIGDRVFSKFDVFPGAATGQFFGFISDTPFMSVTTGSATGSTSANLSFTLDTLVYGESSAITEIPEPATWALAARAVALFAFRRRNHVK
jgi:hypothetical protein